MKKSNITASPLERIDREIEDAVGRIMIGKPQPNDYGVVGDLTVRRVEIAEPQAFARLEKILKVDLPRANRAQSASSRLLTTD